MKLPRIIKQSLRYIQRLSNRLATSVLYIVLGLILSNCSKAKYNNIADPHNASRVLLDQVYKMSTATTVDPSACIGTDENGKEPANDQSGNSIEILFGQTKAGRLCSKDTDYWVFTPTSSFTSVAFFTKQPSDTTVTIADTVISIYDSNLTLLASNDDGYLSSTAPQTTKFSCAASPATFNQGILIKVTGANSDIQGYYDLSLQTDDTCTTLNQ